MNLNVRTFEVTLTAEEYGVTMTDTIKAYNLASLCNKITEVIGTANLTVTSIKEVI